MALEDAIKANTEAVLAQNKLLEQMMAGSKAAPAADKSKPAAASKAKPAAASKAKPAASKSKDETTVDDMAAAFGEYLKTGDTEAREAAKANVKAIVDYFGVAKATAIPAESRDEALGYLETYKAGETPEFDGGSEEEESDSLV